ncbi:MAG: hypothetical protein WCP91_01560 [Candidatus Berkelbacteria bacterium]
MAKLLIHLVNPRFASAVAEDLKLSPSAESLEIQIAANRPEISLADLDGVDALVCSLDTATAVRAMGWNGLLTAALTREPSQAVDERMIGLGIKYWQVFPQFRSFHMPQAPASRAV